MAMWKNDDEMFALMKEKLYTPVVGDILDQMGYKHQFLPASIRPLAAQVPTAPYILPFWLFIIRELSLNQADGTHCNQHNYCNETDNPST